MNTRKTVISMTVDVLDIHGLIEKAKGWLSTGRGHYVCVSNVHMCIEAFDNPDFNQVVNQADAIVPDGRPIYWAQKWLGAEGASQIRGFDLTHAFCQFAQANKLSVGFYGSSETVLSDLQKNLKKQYPQLQVVYAHSPPFRELSDEEKQDTRQAITDSGVRFLFVGLGCPKQEKWMAENKSTLGCVMFGVGAVFDFIAGNKKHAPTWMQRAGLEWLFRLIDEPKRLWRRYLSTNPKFIALLIKQKIKQKLFG